jgi:eukaryotic-like serine/threonine-protein kinase
MLCVRPVSSDALTLGDGRAVSLIENIGRGSCGTVFRGLVESGWGVRRPVAVKVFDTTPESDHGEMMRRLSRIARRAACVRSPSFVQVHEIDRTDGDGGSPQPFIVSELVEGESLAGLVKAWSADGLRVPMDFAIVVMLRTAEGLGAGLFSENADGSLTGLVHGDLSPRQVLISEQGEVKVGDFGQSSLRDLVSAVRSRSRIAYTAPEVAGGAEPDARSDVFSLGIMLSELLVGPRFAPGTDFPTAVQMVHDGRVHEAVMAPNLPRSLRTVIDRAIERHPMNRYAHARAFAFDLRKEMLSLGLCDAQTCVRHAVVGWCEVKSASDTVREPMQSDIIPRIDDDDTAAETRKAKKAQR